MDALSGVLLGVQIENEKLGEVKVELGGRQVEEPVS